MRLTTNVIISLRRSASDPFSMSSARCSLSIVMVRLRICWLLQTRANRDSDHDCPLTEVWTMGIRARRRYPQGAVDGSGYRRPDPHTALPCVPYRASYTTSWDTG